MKINYYHSLTHILNLKIRQLKVEAHDEIPFMKEYIGPLTRYMTKRIEEDES